jgi:hypothetical protein
MATRHAPRIQLEARFHHPRAAPGSEADVKNVVMAWRFRRLSAESAIEKYDDLSLLLSRIRRQTKLLTATE